MFHCREFLGVRLDLHDSETQPSVTRQEHSDFVETDFSAPFSNRAVELSRAIVLSIWLPLPTTILQTLFRPLSTAPFLVPLDHSW
jgi:hypothetical protein